MFDFMMKHTGEVPARHLAQVQMKLRENNLPIALATMIAPFMETVDDADNSVVADLIAVLNILERDEVAPEEALTLIQKAINNLSADAQKEGEKDPEITALYDDFKERPRPTISREVVAIMHGKGNGARANTTNHAPTYRMPGRDGGRMIAAMADGLQARIDRKHTPTIGREFAGMTMGEMAMRFVRSEGQRPMNMQQAVRMATHSTSDFPQVLEGALNKSIARQMEQITPALARAAHEIQAKDYRPGNLLSLSASGMPQEVGENGEIKHVTIDELGEVKPTPRDFGAIFSLSNKAIYNDDLGLFDQINKRMLAGATERFRNVLLEPLKANGGLGHTMADGKTVFHADHGNLAGVGSALDVTSLTAARLALRTQRGKQGELYAIEPWALVVPPQLETEAQQLLAGINATKWADVNPFSGKLELIVEAGLDDPAAWYLIGNPGSSDGLAYSYLDGQGAPRVESKLGWETLGTEFRLVWALDARFVSYFSWFKNPGA